MGRVSWSANCVRSARALTIGLLPDDETRTRACLALAMQGNLHTTTLRGFGEK